MFLDLSGKTEVSSRFYVSSAIKSALKNFSSSAKVRASDGWDLVRADFPMGI
jgi:hypothetical protein